jgi:hypothetical protein
MSLELYEQLTSFCLPQMANVKNVVEAVTTVSYLVIISANRARPLTATFFWAEHSKITYLKRIAKHSKRQMARNCRGHL